VKFLTVIPLRFYELEKSRKTKTMNKALKISEKVEKLHIQQNFLKYHEYAWAA
jgi:hypothetical protein